jgi:hypothetical protein
VAAAQFPGLGIEHFEILEMEDIHGPVPDRSGLICPTLICRRQWASRGTTFERDFNSGWDNSCAEYTQGVAAHDLAYIGLGVAKTTISRRMRTRGRCPHSFAKKPFLLDGF